MTAPPLDLETEIDHLYQGPLRDFTADRKVLVGGLRSEKRRDEADRVQSLGKPSLAAWVLNQLYWRHRGQLEKFLELGDRMRDLQQGKLPREESRTLPKERQDQIALLLGQAQALLQEGGHAAASDTLRKVSNSLDSLAGWGSAYPSRLGRWVEEIRAPALEDLLALAAAAPQRQPALTAAPSKADSGEQARQQRRIEDSRRKLHELGEQNDRLKQELEDAESSRAQAEGAVERTRQALREAQQETQKWESAVRSLRKQLAHLRGQIQAVERELERLDRRQ